MPLVTSKQLMEKAEEGRYAVGAFNAVNMETAQGIIAAAEEENSPLIVQVTQTTLKLHGARGTGVTHLHTCREDECACSGAS